MTCRVLRPLAFAALASSSLLACEGASAMDNDPVYGGAWSETGDFEDEGNSEQAATDEETGETTSGDGDGDESSDTQAGGSGDDDTCAELQVNVQPVPPTIILLLDQSGSMTADFGGASRWDAMYETLQDPDNGVVKQLEGKVRFGLALFTSDDGFENGNTCPMLAQVDAKLNNFDDIDAVFSAASPVEDTPTGESLIAVAEQLAQDPSPGEKIIVLATDGEPDTCDQPDPQEGQEMAVAAAQDAFGLGVSTRVISVGNQVGASHLQHMANAGLGFAPEGTDEAEYYTALESIELFDAFDSILAGAVSCTFSVDGTVDMSQACSGTVSLDGQALDCGNEWEMVDASTVRLLGEACTTLKDGGDHAVNASWSCGVYIP